MAPQSTTTLISMGQSKSQLFLTFLKPSKKSPKLSKNLQKKLKLELEAVSKI
jgi:hypothetical protein